MQTSRRNFLKTAGTASVLLSIGGILPGFSAASYSRIAGANERIRLSITGVWGRGTALASNLARLSECEVATVCDCDSKAIDKCLDAVKKVNNKTPKGEKDFRVSLADKNIDAIRKGTPLACTAETGHQCTALMLLGNIALRTGRTLNLNPANGHIIGDSEAQRLWGRDYEPGWEPKV